MSPGPDGSFRAGRLLFRFILVKIRLKLAKINTHPARKIFSRKSPVAS